jgi:hypothetical protein
MKNIVLISNVYNGGKTYLEYLVPVLNALRDKFNCVVLQTSVTGISQREAEGILGIQVEEVEVDFFSCLESQVVISNDAWVGRLLDDSNFGIFIAHGNVGIPGRDKYYFSDWMSYWDAIVSPSRSSFELTKTGMELYRHDRKALKILIDAKSLRSDLRKTSAVSTLPVKIPEFFRSAPYFPLASEEYVVGLLPTALGVCPSGASLYENMQTVINVVKSQIPHAKFILRPYMTDAERQDVKEICEQLSQLQWISVDNSKQSSKEFYQQCNTVITDASSGGVSFMLNTCRLPIYYIPVLSDSNPIVEAWLEHVGGVLPIARNGEELRDLAIGVVALTPEEHHLGYKNFYEHEYGELQHPNDVFQDLVRKKHESDFCRFTIDSFGRIRETEIVNPESVL